MQSFYNCFEFDHMILDGGDKTVNFEMIKITKGLPKLKLEEGMTFDSCWWNIENATFYFINWQLNPETKVYNPDSKSVCVKQSDLAKHCIW